MTCSMFHVEDAWKMDKDKVQKLKFTLEQSLKAQIGSEGIALLFLNLGVRLGGGGLAPCTGRFTPEKETRYQLYRRPGGPQGWSVASPYTYWAIAGLHAKLIFVSDHLK
jgi:hypothetical protein